MWPFKKKSTSDLETVQTKASDKEATIAAGIDWRQILSEGKSVELFDGCRAKCDGGLEDL